MKMREVINHKGNFIDFINYDFKVLEKNLLSLMFLSNYGEREVSPIIDNIYENERFIELLNSIIVNTYKNRWDRLLKLYETEYSPIYNYKDSITENVSSTDTLNSTYTNTTKYGKIDINEIHMTRTDALQETISDINNDKIFGYNSEVETNADKNIEDIIKDNEGTQKNDGTNTDTLSGQDTTTKVSQGGDKNEKVRKSEHIGNIGNIATQDLISKEFEIWKTNFFNQVLEDIKSLTTLQIYS